MKDVCVDVDGFVRLGALEQPKRVPKTPGNHSMRQAYLKLSQSK